MDPIFEKILTNIRKQGKPDLIDEKERIQKEKEMQEQK